MTAHLLVETVRKSYGAAVALDGVSLSVPRGAYVVLLGPSGSGKTTLLSVIGGFTTPTSGRIAIAGRDVTALDPAARPTATVFQDYALFPHMSVASNVGFGLSVRRVPAPERTRRVQEALAMVGLERFGSRGIHELSGGQRQRVALARALVVEPEILLLDEPLGALDLNLRRQMQDELLALQARTGRSFVHVTHDQEEAMALASLVVVMNQGRIEDWGPPDRVYARPATRFAATFMGEGTLIDGRITGSAGEDLLVETVLGPLPVTAGHVRPAPGVPVTLFLRPESILCEESGDVALGAAIAREIVFQGAHVRVLAAGQASGLAFVLRLKPDHRPSRGERLTLTCRSRDIVLIPRPET